MYPLDHGRILAGDAAGVDRGAVGETSRQSVQVGSEQNRVGVGDRGRQPSGMKKGHSAGSELTLRGPALLSLLCPIPAAGTGWLAGG